MRKKTTEEFKKEVFDLTNGEYSVIGDYISSDTKITIKHEKCNNIYDVRPSSFIKGRRCPKCSGKMKKTTEDFKKEVFDLVGEEYSVLGEYVNNKEKILIRHNICGNEYYTRPNDFQQGYRCNRCYKRVISKKLSKTDEEFKKEVFDLVGEEYSVIGSYINNRTKLTMKHNLCGYTYDVKPNNFLSGNNRCPKCSGNKKKTTEEFKKEVFDLVGEEYRVIGDYVSTNNKILVKHNTCGNEYEVTPNQFLSGCRCPKCFKNFSKTNEEFKREVFELTENEYSVIGDYVNNKEKILLKHNTCGNEYEVTPNQFLSGCRCPKCFSTGPSKNEDEIFDFIKSIYNEGEIIRSYRDILNGKELDIYIPDKQLAIEYDGLYWLSELKKDKNYHLDKTMRCQEKDIRLLHIFEDEWLSKKDIIKDKIRHLLNKNTDKIYARKCYVSEISTQDKNKFLEENHIQGKDSSSIKLGLWYPNGEYDLLVAVMTFCKPRLSLGQKSNKTTYDYELSRYATLLNHSIVGGFSKLLTYFKNNYEWNSFITYADIRYSNGKLYFTNNFKLKHISKPNYWYIKQSGCFEKYHRFGYRKQNLKKLFPETYDDNKTEVQIMYENGFTRIWDCGNYVFEYYR